MILTNILLVICILIVTCCTAMILAGRRRSRDVESDETARREREREQTEQQMQAQMRRIDELNRAFIAEIRQNHANDMAQLQSRHEAQVAELHARLEAQSKEARRDSAMEFGALAEKALRANTDSLRSANREQIDALLTPLKEQIELFNRACTDSYTRENASRKSLSDQIERLMKLNQTIGDEARHLTSALRNDSKVQGDWGEMILETLLENAGMKRDINFFVQLTRDSHGELLNDESGRAQRPDVVVMLPGNRRMVIDSKVSLKSYVDYSCCDDDARKAVCGREHVESVKRHVRELAMKDYAKTIEGSVEHMLMFMPNEGAYLTAVQLDPGLWKYAYDRKIVIVSPTHLFSVMQLVAQMWRQDSQNRNAAEIARVGGLLYDKFVAFTLEMKKLDRSIEDTRRSYDACYNHLTKGGTSLVARSERMRRLGVKARKSLGDQLLADAEIDEDTPLLSDNVADPADSDANP